MKVVILYSVGGGGGSGGGGGCNGPSRGGVSVSNSSIIMIKKITGNG